MTIPQWLRKDMAIAAFHRTRSGRAALAIMAHYPTWTQEYLDAYFVLYGYDAAPYWASRPEHEYFRGVEIEQFYTGH